MIDEIVPDIAYFPVRQYGIKSVIMNRYLEHLTGISIYL